MRSSPLATAVAAPPVPAAARWKAEYDGRLGPAIDLAQAVPGVAPPDALLERLAAAARDPAYAGYGPITGDPALRTALAADIGATYDARIAADDVVITPGCNQAFAATVAALAAAGDSVIVPTPWFFSQAMALAVQGIRAVPLACRADEGFVPSVDAARRLLDPSTRAILLVTPNNPTGATYPPAVIAAFADLAREADIALILDETYRDFLPDGAGRPHALFGDERWRDTLVHLYSFSKSYAVPGHRLGALVAAPALLREASKVLDCTTICPPRAAQAALAWAVDGIRPWRLLMRDAINRRAALFTRAVEAAPGWRVSTVGAYFAYVHHPFGGSAEAVAARLAREAGVVTLPGSFFGPGGEDHLRFAFANVEDRQLVPLADRLVAIGGGSGGP